MIVYFSGTGNSRYAASLLADRLADDLLDAGQWMKEGKKAHLTSESPGSLWHPPMPGSCPEFFRISSAVDCLRAVRRLISS